MNSIVFALEDDALLVANTGAEFTRKGVVSICNMDLSAKVVNSAREPDDGVYKAQGGGLVNEILEDCIKKYNDHKNTFTEDVNDEEKVAKSYTGRFVWELLQNADDAMNTEHSNTHLIGTKGIGFKSVLEITDEPEIYSGDFCFHFSREKSREVLEREISEWQWNEKMGIPVCRLPHAKKPGPAVQKLLKKGYATVLCLPLNEGKRERVEDELSKFCGRSLLFCQHLESVDMRTDVTSRHIEVHRGDGGRVKLTENGRSMHWRVWDDKKDIEGEKRLSVRVCLPVVDGKISCPEIVPQLHVFFPTAESLPNVHALIHASCEVEDNRQHLAAHQPHQDEICEILKGMTKKILSGIPADVALQAFGRTEAEEDAGNRMANQLRNAIAETVRETAFIPLIGGGMARPDDARLWECGLGNAVDPRKVKDQNLCHPHINDDRKSAEILRGLGAKDTSNPELAGLLRFCQNRDGKDCLMAWNVAQALMNKVKQKEKAECKAALLKAPFWLSGNREVKARSIDGEIPLVAIKPKDLPSWLPVDVVDESFWNRIQEEVKRHKEENGSWENALSGSLQPPEKKQGYFDRVLLPYCEKLTPEEWRENGWEILEMAFKWGEKDGRNKPFIIDHRDSKEQQKRAKIFRLPVGKGARKWAPALQCYAGAAWDGPRIFDKYFANVEDRYVLSPTNDWDVDIQDADKNRWKNLLSWLGCSWMLKIQRKNGSYPERNDVDHTWGRPFSDFCFEHFDKMFENPQNGKVSDYAPLLNMIPEMHEIACKEKARYFSYTEKLVDSEALQQLKKNEWVPCKRSLLFPNKCLFSPAGVYLPGSGLGGMLPEFISRNLDQQRLDTITETLNALGANALGAKDGISNDPEQLVHYMNRLSELPRKNETGFRWGKDDKDRGKIACAAAAIFSAYAKIESPPDLDGDVMVPCLRHTRRGEIIYFERAGGACWADKSYFGEAGVRREILKEDGLHVFFRFLQDGESFGLRSLSEFLRLGPQRGKKIPDAAKKLSGRYKERRVGMAKATGQNLPEQLEIVAYESIALSAPAHVKIMIPAIKFWKRDERTVDINAGDDAGMWQGLAAALGELKNCSQHKQGFELLLKEKTKESFLSRLRDDYHLTEESINAVEESTPHEDDNMDVTKNDSETEQENNHDNSINMLPPSRDAVPHSIESGDRSPSSTTQQPLRSVDGNYQQHEQHKDAPEIEVVSGYTWGARRVDSVKEDAGNGTHGAGDSDGKRGEEALLKWLKCKFGDSNVTNKNEHDRNHPGYDILVTKDGKKHYFECKSFASATPPRRVSMTKTQFIKAKHAQDCYWLCVIYDVNADPVKMLPIQNPAALENEPVVTEYKINLASRRDDGNQ